jgi:hypothetical protein
MLFFSFCTMHLVLCFGNNQDMHQFLLVFYFTLLFLHVLAPVCHPQGACLYLLNYLPTWVFWLIKFFVVCGYVYVMW